MVNITPLGGDREGGSFPNMNPAMNSVIVSAPGNVQVMNVLDEPQASNTLEQFAMADNGFLEGIPGGMFDWGEYCPVNKFQLVSSPLYRSMGYILLPLQCFCGRRRRRRNVVRIPTPSSELAAATFSR